MSFLVKSFSTSVVIFNLRIKTVLKFILIMSYKQFLMIMSDPQYYRCASRAIYNILNRRRCTMLQ